jgi:hypothetical protein
MTSLLKHTAVNAKTFPTVQFVGGPYYFGTNGQRLLFPFTFQNGCLEIEPNNGFDLLSNTQPLGINGAAGFQIRRMGGQNLVQTIGNNFKTYIFHCNWSESGSDTDYNIQSLQSIAVHSPGIVTRVQQLSNQNLSPYSNPSTSFVLSSNPPNTDFVSNLPSFGATYAFEKPLVV